MTNGSLSVLKERKRSKSGVSSGRGLINPLGIRNVDWSISPSVAARDVGLSKGAKLGRGRGRVMSSEAGNLEVASWSGA